MRKRKRFEQLSIQGIPVPSAADCGDPIRCIVADPPWPFRDRLPGGGRGAVKHYSLMTVPEIVALPMADGRPIASSACVADSAYLLLWRVASMPREALEVAEGWGFKVKAEIVWRKITSSGKRHFGMGHHVRSEHEIALVCTRGSPHPISRSTRSVFDAEVLEHSRKPAAFLDLVEATFPGPYLELFARRVRPGWLQMGDELTTAPNVA